MKQIPIHNKHFIKVFNEFNDFVQMQGYSTKGKKEIYFPVHIKEFLFFLEQTGFTNIKQVTAQEIIAYHEYLQVRPNQIKEGGLSDISIAHHIQALRLFFDYLVDIDQIDSCPARLPKFIVGDYNQRNIVTVDEVKEIYKACVTKRDKALVAVAYGCGLRRHELYQLNAVDVLLHKGTLLVRDGKGNQSRIIPLSESVLATLKDYFINERQSYCSDSNIAEQAFFINNEGRRMRGINMGLRLKQIITRTNNTKLIEKNITLHCLRHSIATHLLDNGASVEFVQSFLGHKDIDSTHHYSKRRKQQTAILKQFN